jgi:ribosomal protein S18 acetylase RimI-like enzyme
VIREAIPAEDIDELFELWKELMQLHQSHHAVFRVKPSSAQQLREELMNRLKEKDTKVFVYEKEGEPIGMILTSVRRSAAGFKLSTKGYIAETIVNKNHRGTGIGKELVETAKKWLSDKGADHIELQVSVKNPAAIHFWETQGFSVSTQHMVLEIK